MLTPNPNQLEANYAWRGSLWTIVTLAFGIHESPRPYGRLSTPTWPTNESLQYETTSLLWLSRSSIPWQCLFSRVLTTTGSFKYNL